MNITRTDFVSPFNQRAIKTWYINQVIQGASSPYSLIGKTIVLEAFDRQNPEQLVFSISPTDQGLGYAVFEFTPLQASQLTLLDYRITEAPDILLAYGTINFVDLTNYIPFRDILTQETPPGITIPEGFVNVSAYYWRSLFKSFSNSALTLSDVHQEATWPNLYNFLIAKLVVYSFIEKSLKAFLAQGGDDASGGNSANVKSIETGPTKVEYHDSMKSLADLLKTNAQGDNALNHLREDICSLCGTLGVHIGFCKQGKTPIIPKVQGAPLDPNAIEILTKYYNE